MNNAKISIVETVTPKGGTLSASVSGHESEAEMTWSASGDHLRIVDHTAVPDSLRGLGVGLALAEHMVALARKDKVKLYPLCPFFMAMARKHGDWLDVVDMPGSR